ncbi:uncharacterized protein LOC125847518 [Solanum stenotomum]|uniref:uncharacterized protein LOC125847518 n=1 Tax=Solanum stenotomum TaxID=172797 RepID=UPI0020D0459C|nr:uncharacterized protein LOC125847518 [Solanum stenotomum]
MDVPATTSDSAAAVPTTTHMVQFNPTAQLPIKLQGNLNFATWKAQLVIQLNGHKYLGHLTGAKSAPPTTITQTDSTISNHEYELWFCQDQLIQQAMMGSVDPTIAPTVATASSASKTVATYLQEIRSIFHALKVVGSLVADDELAVKILSGLGYEYHEITVAIRARNTTLSFEDLFQKFTDHELLFKHQDIDRSSSIITAVVAQRTNFQPQNQKNNRRFPNQSSRPQAPRQAVPGNQHNGRLPRQTVNCQLCQKISHTADVCRSKLHNHFEVEVNFVSNHHSDANPWILGSYTLEQLIMSQSSL